METNTYKIKKRTAMQNGTAPPVPGQIAFGTGGHNADLSAKYPDPSDTALRNEVIRKDYSKLYNENPYSFTVIGILEEYELIDYEISEAGLFDSDGDLMAIMNFDARKKKSGVQHIARFKLNF